MANGLDSSNSLLLCALQRPFEELRIGTRVSFASSCGFDKRRESLNPQVPPPLIQGSNNGVGTTPLEAPASTAEQTVEDDGDPDWMDEDVDPHNDPSYLHDYEDADDNFAAAWEDGSGHSSDHSEDDWLDSPNDSADESHFGDEDDEDGNDEEGSDDDSIGRSHFSQPVDRDVLTVAIRRQALLQSFQLDSLVSANGPSHPLTKLEVNFPIYRSEHIFAHILPNIPTLRHVYFAFGLYYLRSEGSTQPLALPSLESLGYIQNPHHSFWEDCLISSIKSLAIQIQLPKEEAIFKSMLNGLERPTNHIQHLQN